MEIFQTESSQVLKHYSESKNYKIIINDKAKDLDTVAIYFSSNGIYYPNEVDVFNKSIVEKDRYEWMNNMIPNIKKHIFVRDIFKQWYIKGINNDLCNIQELFVFLKKETEGLKIITIGSSAGGYAATLLGKLLNAEYILTFAGQFTLLPQIKSSDKFRDPLLFENIEKIYSDLSDIIASNSTPIYYFAPSKSKVDKAQIEFIKGRTKYVRLMLFNSKRHGIPFTLPCLSKILEYRVDELEKMYLHYKGKVINNLFFSLKMAGFEPNIRFALTIVKRRIIGP